MNARYFYIFAIYKLEDGDHRTDCRFCLFKDSNNSSSYWFIAFVFSLLQCYLFAGKTKQVVPNIMISVKVDRQRVVQLVLQKLAWLLVHSSRQVGSIYFLTAFQLVYVIWLRQCQVLMNCVIVIIIVYDTIDNFMYILLCCVTTICIFMTP